MSKGFIKLYRTLKDWEWYDDANCVLLLVHLLISVNYKDKKWKGKTIKAGSMVLSWDTLSRGAKMSIQQCRTAMKKLEDSNEVTRKITGKHQVVTLVKWDKLQSKEFIGNNQINNKPTFSQQLDNNQSTTTKEGKEIKEGKEKRNLKKLTKKDFKKMFLDLGAQEQHIDDWFKARDKKKLVYTETAFIKFTNECNDNNYPIPEAIKNCAENGWGGFKYSWVQNINNGISESTTTINRQTRATYLANREGW